MCHAKNLCFLFALCSWIIFPAFHAQSAPQTDKFSLWQNPSFFRGAAIHPYNPFYAGVEVFSFVTKEDFAALKNQGANVVSLNYPGPYNAEAPYALDTTKLKWLDDAIQWSEEVGLYAVIHFRNGPGKSEETFSGSPDGADEVLWYSQVAKDKWVEMWRFVADRYKNRTHVIAYNLMVEPHPDVPVKQAPLPASVWFDLAKKITTSIRQVDSQTPIIVSATAWSNPLGMEDAVTTGDSRTIYSFHMYEPSDFTHQGFEWAGKGDISGLVYPGKITSDIYTETMFWDKNRLKDVMKHALAFQNKHKTPIFIGEFGCNRRVPSCIAFLDDLISIFEEYGWSYTHFLWRDVIDGQSGDFDFETEPTGTARVAESSYMRMFKKHWAGAGAVSPSSGSLIKLSCPAGAAVDHPCKAVYFYASDSKRHAFPNEKVYFTWYTDFSQVQTISSALMASLPLGSNVTYRPGTRMVKFVSLPKVYAVSKNSLLRWVTSEAVAISIYGSNWNQKIDDISDAFFTDYRFGMDINSESEYSPRAESGAVTTIDVDKGLGVASLKTLAQQRGIRFGSLYQYDIHNDLYNQLFEQEMNALTIGSFWDDGFRENRASYKFTEMDEQVQWGQERGMDLFAQTLVWFEDVPDWLKTTPNIQVETIMNEHIDTVVGRYKGKIKFWNVVNEAVDIDGTLRKGHKWVEAMGNDYIRKAFVRARAADPNAVLYYNEYDIESNQAKYEGTKALLLSLKSQGTPVQALGWQMHVKPGSFDAATLLARLNEIADLGFDNYITELDVELPENASATDYEQQKQTIKTVIQTFLASRRHKDVIVWGLRDGDPYWLTNNHPQLFDEKLNKKPAYFGVHEALK